MITTIALLTFAVLPAPAVVELYPTDDVWAYPHASEPDKDPYLRVWGFEGASVANSADESDSFGYSFLRFDGAGLPKGELKSATLTLVHIAKPSFDFDQAGRAPLEARPVSSAFSEKSWGYGDLSKFMPSSGKGSVYGTGSPEKFDPEKEFPIKIDLMKGPGSFAKAVEAARTSGSFAIALTTAMSPEGDVRAIYKVYSKDGPKESRPVLRLEFGG